MTDARDPAAIRAEAIESLLIEKGSDHRRLRSMKSSNVTTIASGR